jgi:hypothetical protein
MLASIDWPPIGLLALRVFEVSSAFAVAPVYSAYASVASEDSRICEQAVPSVASAESLFRAHLSDTWGSAAGTATYYVRINIVAEYCIKYKHCKMQTLYKMLLMSHVPQCFPSLDAENFSLFWACFGLHWPEMSFQSISGFEIYSIRGRPK